MVLVGYNATVRWLKRHRFWAVIICQVLFIHYDPGLTRPSEKCIAFLRLQIRNLRLQIKNAQGHPASKSHSWNLNPVFLCPETSLSSDTSRGKAYSPAVPDERCYSVCTCAWAHAHICFGLKLLQMPEFLYKVTRAEVQREIQVEWFEALERHY